MHIAIQLRTELLQSVPLRKTTVGRHHSRAQKATSDMNPEHPTRPAHPRRSQRHRGQQHAARGPHLRREVVPPARLQEGAGDGAPRETGDGDEADDEPHARAELAQVVRQRRQRDGEERLDAAGHEAVGDREAVEGALRVPHRRPAVQHDGHGGRGRDRRVERAEEARRDVARDDAARDAEGVEDEEEVDGIQGGEGDVGVGIDIDLAVVKVR